MPPSETDPNLMQVRSYQTRATVSEDGRTISGIGVPYGVEIEYTPGFFERFEPGSVDDAGAILRYGHIEPLGILLDASDSTEGRLIEARISATQRGRDIATLIIDGALSKLSIGFFPVDYTDEERSDGLHRVYQRVKAIEYSVVEFPAYPTASINEIRSTLRKGPTMTDPDLSVEIRTLGEQFTDFQRETRSALADLQRGTDDGIPFAFRSLGDYARALAIATNDHHAEARAAFTGVIADKKISRPEWLGVLEKRMTAKQEVTGLFMHTMDLPATGMSVEYAVKAGKTGVKVAEQAAQGDALATGNPATYEIKSAPVKTYGGAGALSFQAIERASISILDDLLYDQAMAYATQIETVTRTLFGETVTAAEAEPTHTFASLASATVGDWIAFILALIDVYDATAYLMDGLAVSGPVFEALALLPEDRKALQFTGTPTDKQGTLTLIDGGAAFASVTVRRIPRWDGMHAVAYSREAIRIKEAPGAPLRLQDSSILDLTKQFAVYGYASHFAPHADLIKAAKFTA